MNLLIITQKVDVNDDILGFFHRWVEEFAEHCEKIIVICLEKGEYRLPANVKVFSLGKEEINNFQFSIFNFQIFKKLKHILNFYRYIWREQKNYDAIFVHMNPEYVVLGGLLWHSLRKKIGLWYVHKQIDFKLKLAEKLVDYIFTASKESFRLLSKKVNIVGHGIDLEKFKLKSEKLKINEKFKIISVGRIAPVKNYEVLIEAAEILKNKNFDFEINLAGGPILKQDKIYFEKLRNLIKERQLDDKVKFVGSIPYRDIAEFYQKGDLFVNLSDTGGLDKAVLEAMASGLLVLTSNEAFKNILPEKYFTNKNPKEIAERILTLSRADFDPGLQEYVVKNHSLDNLINNMLYYFQ